MRIKAEQLASQLEQHWPVVTLIYGDEALLVEEAADSVRQRAKKLQIIEREVWHVDGRFDWSQIKLGEETLSLFSSRKLVEFRIPGGAPGKEGAEKIRRFVETTPEDISLLIISGKLTTTQQKSKWFTDIDRIGLTLPVWPIDAEALPRWIQQRLQSRELQANVATAALMAERVEGNLFAAAQEIDKLKLLCPDGKVDEQMILSSVVDSARFEAFGLMNAIMQGQAEKIPRMLSTLRAEGTEAMAVFSALSWSVQRLADMAQQLAQRQDPKVVFKNQKPPVWPNAQSLTLQTIKRHPPRRWQLFLSQMAAVDQAAKGNGVDNPWRLLERVSLQIAATPILTNSIFKG